MFGLDWSELALIAAVALIVIGPKDLPRVLRTAGQWAARARALAREFQHSLDDIVREADLEDIRSQAEKAAKFDFADEVKRQIDPDGELRKGLEAPPELSEPLTASGSSSQSASLESSTETTSETSPEALPEASSGPVLAEPPPDRAGAEASASPEAEKVPAEGANPTPASGSRAAGA